MIKIIFLDIDGTLTNDEKVITPKTREALLAAQEKGVKLAIASGRPGRGLYRWAEELDLVSHHGLFVCFNGASVMDSATKEELYSHCMSVEDAKAVIRHIAQFDVIPMIARSHHMHTTDIYGATIDYRHKEFDIVRFEARSNGFLLCEHRDLEAWITEPVEKVLTAGDPAYLRAHWEEMYEPFKDRLSGMFTSDYYFEYTAKGVDKGKAIAAVGERLGIAREEMMAFGDAENDIAMLKYVGCGVAMGNAMESVKAIADEVTLDNNHDGIAAALEKHGVI
ncbi:MAG: HAD family phosphatase [Lachnospiraceae bacterium]|nr:HAD family phosphatase [Lachnospiraceae bacterium]MBQ9593776.1 HAD family phosphatase [Lachnospiraceae bacterium]MBR0153547.1 HAD family phosphatase [Lachnospiraceae bacterium]